MSWNKELEGGLPDCRLRGPARRSRTVPYRGSVMERVYCANCGSDGGLITADWAVHVFYLCDRCAETNGDPPGALKLDERSVRGA